MPDARGRKSLDDAIDTYKEKWYKKVRLIARPDSGKKKECRPVGGVYEVAQHWLRSDINKLIKKDFPLMCLRYNLEAQAFDNDQGLCPVCQNFSDRDLPKHLQFGVGLSRYVEAFDLTRILAGDKTDIFGYLTPNKWGLEQIREMKEDHGSAADDPKHGYSVGWRYKDVQDTRSRNNWVKGRFNKCPCRWDKKRGVWIMTFKGEQYVGEPVDFNAIIEPPTYEEIEADLERLGLIAQLEEETGKMARKSTKKSASKSTGKKRRKAVEEEDEYEDDEEMEEEEYEEEEYEEEEDEDLDEDEEDEYEEDDEDEEDEDEDLEDDEDEDDEDEEEEEEDDEDDEYEEDDEDEEEDEEEEDEDDEDEDEEEEEDEDDDEYEEDDEDEEEEDEDLEDDEEDEDDDEDIDDEDWEEDDEEDEDDEDIDDEDEDEEEEDEKPAPKRRRKKKVAEKPPKGKRRVAKKKAAPKKKKAAKKKATVKNPRKKRRARK